MKSEVMEPPPRMKKRIHESTLAVSILHQLPLLVICPGKITQRVSLQAMFSWILCLVGLSTSQGSRQRMSAVLRCLTRKCLFLAEIYEGNPEDLGKFEFGTDFNIYY